MLRYRVLQFRMPIRDPTILYQRFSEEWSIPPVPPAPPPPAPVPRSSSPMVISGNASSVSDITTPPSSEDESAGVIFGKRRRRRIRRRRTKAGQDEEVEMGLGMLPLTEESKRIHESGMYYHGPAPRQEGRRRGRPRIGECGGFVEHPLGLTQKDVERVRKGIKPSAVSTITPRKGTEKARKKVLASGILLRDIGGRARASNDKAVKAADQEGDDDTDEYHEWDPDLRSAMKEMMTQSSPARGVEKRRRSMREEERRKSSPAVIPATDSSESLISTGPPRKVAKFEVDSEGGTEIKSQLESAIQVERVIPDSADEDDGEEEEEEFVMASQPSTADEIHVRSFSKSPLPAPPPTFLTTTQYFSPNKSPSPTYMTAIKSPHQTQNNKASIPASSSEEEADSSVEVHESMTVQGTKPDVMHDDDGVEDSIVVKDSFSYPAASTDLAASSNYVSLQTPTSKSKKAIPQGSASTGKLSQSSITASWYGLKSSKEVVPSPIDEKQLGGSCGIRPSSSGRLGIARHSTMSQKPSLNRSNQFQRFTHTPMSSTTTLKATTQVANPSQSQSQLATDGTAPTGSTRSRNSVKSFRSSERVEQDDDDDAPPCSQPTPIYHPPTQHVFTIGKSSSEDEAVASQFSSTLH